MLTFKAISMTQTDTQIFGTSSNWANHQVNYQPTSTILSLLTVAYLVLISLIRYKFNNLIIVYNDKTITLNNFK
jgi:hypothetical protein